MKALNTILIASVLFVLAALITSPNIENAEARRARRYLWIERIPINSVTYTDTLFPIPWEQVSVICDSGDARIQFSGSDTSSFSSRIKYKLRDGDALIFGPADKLRRISARASVLTNDTLYLVGYKSESQF